MEVKLHGSAYGTKQRLELSEVPVHAMKAYGGSRETAPLIPSLATRRGWGATFTIGPQPSGKEFPIE